MKVFRFMSNNEFNKFRNGDTLTNTTKFQGRTNSEGFCFLNFDEYKPEYACHFLHGAIGAFPMEKMFEAGICAVFEVDDKLLKQTYGKYLKPLTLEEYKKHKTRDMFTAKEYCTTTYNNKDFKLIKYTIPKWFDFSYEDWKWIENGTEKMEL